MTSDGWYESVTNSSLEQGDILFKLDIVQAVLGDLDPGSTDLDIELETVDTIVLTQTCDIENKKSPQLLLARVVAYDFLVEEDRQRGKNNIGAKKFRENSVAGNFPSNSLLHACDGDPQLPWSFVDFRQLFTLPVDYVAAQAASQLPRLRLISPYRENLAQNFARYFMRVALPKTAHEFISYEPKPKGVATA